MAEAHVPSHRRIVVTLQRPSQLFTADQVTPTSDAYTEYTAQPAMDTVRDMLMARQPPRDAQIELVIRLPRDQMHEGIHDELTDAVRRWLRVQNVIDIDATHAGGAVGRRLLALGIVSFLILQISSLFVRNGGAPDDEYLFDALGEGLSVTSWVMLWFPVQLVTMEVWRSAIRRRRMRIIERINVVLEEIPARSTEAEDSGRA